MSTVELSSVKASLPGQRVSVVGVGRAGNNMLSRAINGGLSPNQCVAVNTDRSELSRSPARSKVFLSEETKNGSSEPSGLTRNLRLSIHRITPFTESSDLTIVVAGLGGETGTGAAPLIAQYSRNHIHPVVSVVTIPFIHERSRRLVALRGLKKMVDTCDCTVVVDNGVGSDKPSWEGRTSDHFVSLAVSGLSSFASQADQIQNERFQRIVSLGPIATFCFSSLKSTDRVQTAVLRALRNPSARLPLPAARGGILVYIGPGGLRDSDVAQAYETIASLVGHDIEFSYGSVEFSSDPSVCLLLTGYKYGPTVRTFVDFIEDLYDTEYGQTSSGSVVGLQMPLFQMEQV